MKTFFQLCFCLLLLERIHCQDAEFGIVRTALAELGCKSQICTLFGVLFASCPGGLLFCFCAFLLKKNTRNTVRNGTNLEVGVGCNGLSSQRVTYLYASFCLLRLCNFFFSSRLTIAERLNGTIPTILGLLTELTFLHLIDNKNLSGTIPTELGLLTKLTNLRLHQNRLTGVRPIAWFFYNFFFCSTLLDYSNSSFNYINASYYHYVWK